MLPREPPSGSGGDGGGEEEEEEEECGLRAAVLARTDGLGVDMIFESRARLPPPPADGSPGGGGEEERGRPAELIGCQPYARPHIVAQLRQLYNFV